MSTTLTPFSRLRALLTDERRDIWVVLIYSVVIGLLSLVVPMAVQWLVNTVAFGTVLQPLVVLTLFVFVALGFSSLLTGLRHWVVELIQQRVMVRVAATTLDRLLHARVDAFDRSNAPELVNRFFDSVTVQKAGATLLVDGVALAMQTAIGMILLALYHPLLLAFDAMLVVFLAFVLFVMGRGATATAIKESKYKYSIAAWLETLAGSLATFKTQSGAAYATERTDSLVRGYIGARQSHFRVVMRQIGGFLVLQALASSVLLGVGGYLVIQRQLTLGQLVAAELVVTVVVGGLSKFGKHLEAFYDLIAAVDKLGYISDLPVERESGEPVPLLDNAARVEMRNVSFGYRSGSPILRHADLVLEPGSRVGLFGPIGSGKSALADLLFGLRQPANGVIEIDGHDYRDISLRSLRGQVALLRGNEIFDGSVADNVRLGSKEMGVAQVREALKSVGLLEEIQSFPEGINTELTSGGRPLSPGQAERLMMARALASRPRLLIIDEALDHVDDVREREHLLDAVFAKGRDWTILAISASPDVLERCDRVYAIEGGLIEPTEPFQSAARKRN